MPPDTHPLEHPGPEIETKEMLDALGAFVVESGELDAAILLKLGEGKPTMSLHAMPEVRAQMPGFLEQLAGDLRNQMAQERAEAGR